LSDKTRVHPAPITRGPWFPSFEDTRAALGGGIDFD
jgi:hypothetical protein